MSLAENRVLVGLGKQSGKGSPAAASIFPRWSDGTQFLAELKTEKIREGDGTVAVNRLIKNPPVLEGQAQPRQGALDRPRLDAEGGQWHRLRRRQRHCKERDHRAAAAGATSLTHTAVVGGAPVANTETYIIDQGLATQEAVTPTNVSGTGPYTLTVPATKFAHSANAPATIVMTHTFREVADHRASVVRLIVSGPQTGRVRYLRASIACAGVLAAAILAVGLLMPRPFHGSGTVLVVDAIALLAGFVAMVVLPPLMTRSIGWGAVIALVSVPTYLVGGVVGFVWAPYLVAWARCGHRPAIASSFAASYTYRLPGDLDYGPNLFDDSYPCSAKGAEAAGYHRTPFHQASAAGTQEDSSSTGISQQTSWLRLCLNSCKGPNAESGVPLRRCHRLQAHHQHRLFELPKEEFEVGPDSIRVWMVGSQHPLHDGQGAHEEGRGGGHLALGLELEGQVVEALGGAGVVGP